MKRLRLVSDCPQQKVRAVETSKTLAVDTLQRVLMPKKGEPHDVRMLYLIEQEHNKQRLRWSDRTSLSLIHI